jgi:HAE1 family hydrophobic/amphiphilic exporter-1
MSSFGNRQVSLIYEPSNQYEVILEVEPRYQRTPEALAKFYVRSSQERLVPLDTVVDVKRTIGPLSISHFGQLPATTVSFSLQPGHSLGEATQRVERRGPRYGYAVNDHTAFPGDGQRVPGIVPQSQRASS